MRHRFNKWERPAGEPDPQYTAMAPHPSCRVYSPPREKISGLTESQRKMMSRPMPGGRGGVMRPVMRGGPLPLGIDGTLAVSRHASPVVETYRSDLMRGEPWDLIRKGSRRGRGRKMNLHESNLAHRLGVAQSARLQAQHVLDHRAQAHEAAWVAKRYQQLRDWARGKLRLSAAQATAYYNGLRQVSPHHAHLIDKLCLSIQATQPVACE